jgi:flavin-dependent dehydrogenase
MGYEAASPISERGFVRGATMALPDGSTQDVRARFLVVADGANSRFGRGLGTTRQRHWPYVIATRTYFASPRAAEEWTEARLGPPDPNGHPISGFGWVHPLGDGTVNVGLGMLSSYRDVRGLNAIGLLREFADDVADDWGLDPTQSLKEPARFRVPLGGSVGPKMGPTFLVTGDAGGLANPFNGEGIEPALVSGRIAADVLDEALTTGNSTTLQQYPIALDAELGPHHGVGRLSARFVGRPVVLRAMLRWGARSPKVMGGVLRIATNELRREHPGAAERSYAVARAVSRLAPGW